MPAKRLKSKPANSHKKDSVSHSLSQQGEFLVAAVGASAGGVEAFTELLTNLPPDTGMAFVLIQHLDPKHESLLSALLAKKSTMPVVEVRKGMKLEPNHVYVIPPNATMTISDHSLQLEKRIETGGTPMPVDLFMRSLAEQQGNRAIGIILSGLGSDGTLGMAEIQAQGGVTFAQDEGSAKYDSMPRSVIDAGSADYVLPPKSIARELVRIARHPYTAHPKSESYRRPGSAGKWARKHISAIAARHRTRFHALPAKYDFAADSKTDGRPQDRQPRSVRAVSAGESARNQSPLSGHADQRHQLLPESRFV